MRISDWSSDVCSSDLRDRQFVDLISIAESQFNPLSLNAVEIIINQILITQYLGIGLGHQGNIIQRGTVKISRINLKRFIEESPFNTSRKVPSFLQSDIVGHRSIIGFRFSIGADRKSTRLNSSH